MNDPLFLIDETLAEKAPVTQAALTHHVLICTGKSCSANDSNETLEAFWKVLADKNLLYGKRGSWSGSILVSTTGSIGLCQVGPAVMVYPEGVWYHSVTPQDVPEIVESHLIQGNKVTRLLAKTF